ncbi:MAG: ketoacyl-synthetase C-terminal extension domain-containing protein, partial [Exilibacterium sp.]
MSSFGAGGANAHVILEEFCAPEAEADEYPEFDALRPALVVLSARTEGQLRQQAINLRTADEKMPSHEKGTSANRLLADI